MNILESMERKHDFLICIDSDGCVFDNMELKHKECFCPATVNVWNLQGISRYVREAADFVNLYSTTRGTNRFPSLICTLKLVFERKEVKARGYEMPDLTSLKKWIQTTPVLGASALENYCRTHDADAILLQTNKWSNEVNENIARIVRNVPPLPFVRETLKKFREYADIVIVSATPHEAIVREWEENNLLEYVDVIAGQELGTKEDCIRSAITGKYDKEHVLMIGDAPGDKIAALNNDVLFRPIVPGFEMESWKRLLNEDLDSFINGTYKNEKMKDRFNEFNSMLLEKPPWENK